MKGLSELVATSENWLIARVLHYAKEHGYVRYTSTLEADPVILFDAENRVVNVDLTPIADEQTLSNGSREE